MLLGYDRAESGVFMIGRSELKLFGKLDKVFHKLIRYAFLSDNNGQSHAALTRAAEGGIDYAASAALKRRVLKHETVVLRLAKRLNSFAVFGGCGVDVKPDRG